MLKQPIRIGFRGILLAIIASVATNCTAAQDHAMTIVCANPMEVEAVRFWLDENYSEQSYGTIAARGEHSQQTSPRHLWRIKQSGHTLQNFRVIESPKQSFVIKLSSAGGKRLTLKKSGTVPKLKQMASGKLHLHRLLKKHCRYLQYCPWQNGRSGRLQ